MNPIRVFLLLALAYAMPAHAQGSCNECKYLVCLKNKVENLRQWIAEYGKLKKNFGPTLSIDVTGMKDSERAAVKQRLRKERDDFFDLRDKIDLPFAGCGGTGTHTAKTDFEHCKIDKESVAAAKKSAACTELGQRFEAHENFHFDECVKRNKKTYMTPIDPGVPYPAIIMTGAGIAAEEIKAHERDLKAIKKIADNLQKRCWMQFKQPVTLSCKMYEDSAGNYMKADTKVTGCSDGTGTNWQFQNDSVGVIVAKGVSTTTGETIDKPWSSPCEEQSKWQAGRTPADPQVQSTSNAGTWVCTYHWAEGADLPQFVLHNYPMAMCKGAQIAHIPVPLEWREKCEFQQPMHSKPPAPPAPPAPPKRPR